MANDVMDEHFLQSVKLQILILNLLLYAFIHYDILMV